MSNFFVDEQIVGPTFHEGFNLSSVLVDICNRQDDKVVKIQINEPGVYYLNNALRLYCNLIIEGCEGAVISVKYMTDSDYNGDSFLHFNYITNIVHGNTSYIRPNIIIKNVEFRIDNTHWWHSTNNIFHYMKFYWAQSIHIENVKMKLEGQHILTNFDMRECENVIVEKCLLENYHYNTEQINGGGILWFRGMTKNIKITNNFFKKSGNDEALGFLGHYSDYHNNGPQGYNYYIIPESEEPADGICHKENIIVDSNVFEYQKHYSNSNTNDCLISIIDHDRITYPEQSHQGASLFHLENIVFENNKIIINDCCRRFIKCSFEDQTILRDILFKNNKINIGNFMVVDSRITAFDLRNKFRDIDTKYVIDGNILHNKAFVKLYDNEPGLYFLIQDGGEVTVSNNVTRIDETLPDQIYRKIRFFWNNHLNNKVSLFNNDLDGLHILGSISCSSATGSRAIENVDIIIKDNIAKGDTSMYFKNVGDMNVSIINNYFESKGSVIALNNASGSIFNYINNHVVSKNTNPNNQTLYYSGTSQNINCCCIKGNTFEHFGSNILSIFHNYVNTNELIEDNNTFYS